MLKRQARREQEERQMYELLDYPEDSRCYLAYGDHTLQSVKVSVRVITINELYVSPQICEGWRTMVIDQICLDQRKHIGSAPTTIMRS